MRTIDRTGAPQRQPRSLRLSPDIDEQLLDAARSSGTSFTTEAEHCIRLGLNVQARLGGPKEAIIIESAAQSAVARVGAGWASGNPYRFVAAIEAIYESLMSARPVLSDAEWATVLARQTLEAVKRCWNPEGVAAHCPAPEPVVIRADLAAKADVAGVLQSMTDQIVDAARASLAATATSAPERLADKQPARTATPISRDHMINAAWGVVDRLRTTRNVHHRDYLRDMLRRFAANPNFPASVRDEFAQAAAAELPAVSDEPPPPALPVPDEWRPPEIHLFDSALALAKVDAIGRFGVAEPSSEQVDAVFAENPVLINMAKLVGPQSPDTIRRHRLWVEGEKARLLAAHYRSATP